MKEIFCSAVEKGQYTPPEAVKTQPRSLVLLAFLFFIGQMND